MNPRQSPRSTRIDLRIPNDLLETVQSLARDRFNAPIHHISGKPEITPVIVDLIRLGITALDDHHPDTRPDSHPETYPDNVVTREEMTAAIESLRTEFQPALELAGK